MTKQRTPCFVRQAGRRSGPSSPSMRRPSTRTSWSSHHERARLPSHMLNNRCRRRTQHPSRLQWTGVHMTMPASRGARSAAMTASNKTLERLRTRRRGWQRIPIMLLSHQMNSHEGSGLRHVLSTPRQGEGPGIRQRPGRTLSRFDPAVSSQPQCLPDAACSITPVMVPGNWSMERWPEGTVVRCECALVAIFS